MQEQVFNPYLPLNEYIPDGEPHVFGDRVYVYGSHDRFNGKKFCLNDYVCYSANVNDLINWRYEGVIYKRKEDPRLDENKNELWAPDVVKGKDGRYYLYYCPDDSIKSIGVAVCDSPAGEFHFLGTVKDKEGGIIGERVDDTICFDPGVFIDDDGKIYLYSGNGPRTKSAIGKEPKMSTVMELNDDMLTIKSEPKHLLPTLGEADGTGFDGHEFFEASSIRKINDKYYLVYSSVNLHELCYAISDFPDRDFKYGGVIVSNSDVFENSYDKTYKNCYGNNHGGIELINGEYYVFYHRQTNRSMFSRQGCAEKIKIKDDGSIAQEKITSCGLNGSALKAEGIYPASICCHLHGKHTPVISHKLAMGNRHPYITQNGDDMTPIFDSDGFPNTSENQIQFITNCKNGFKSLYRYFDFKNVIAIKIRLKGSMRGIMHVYYDEGDKEKQAGTILVKPSKSDYNTFEGQINVPDGVHSLSFYYEGRGKFDFYQFEFIIDGEKA